MEHIDEDEEKWGKLPPHVVIKIFKNLNVSDIIKLSMSNKRFHKLATHNKVWKARCLKLRDDILFLSIAGGAGDDDVLPSWLVHYDEIKNHEELRPPPLNFFFVEFMRVWCRYPHAWKRGNTIVDTKYVQMQPIQVFYKDRSFTCLTKEVVIFAREIYENWREWYCIVIPATIWLHNRQNGAYEIKRYTIEEPFFFELPFSNLLYGVDAKDKKILSFRKPTFERPRFTLYNRKLERSLKSVTSLTKNAALLGGVAIFGYLFLKALTAYHVPYHIIVDNVNEICEIVRPTMERLLDPEFKGSLIDTVNDEVCVNFLTADMLLGMTAGVSAFAGTAIRQLQSVFGVVSLFAYDQVLFENVVPLKNLSIFVTTENDVSKYECAVVKKQNGGVPSTWPVPWIHDMDDGKYDQMGSSICVGCNQHEGTHELHGLKELGAFCGNECAERFWNRK